MALTISAAIKAYLETKGLGIQFFKDAAPDAVKRPYATISEGIAVRMDPMEDGGPAAGSGATAKELVQLDLWQSWQDDAGKVIESATLPDAITEAIHGSRLLSAPAGSTPPKMVYGVLQEGRVRLLDRNSGIVQHAFTLAVYRSI